LMLISGIVVLVSDNCKDSQYTSIFIKNLQDNPNNFVVSTVRS
jgi:hypothetical protein